MKPILSIAVGVLGLCAIVLSSPYDIPTYVPEALILLCEHFHDPDMIQVCIFQSASVVVHENFCL
jgi:proteasome activator subunit 4